MNSNKISVVLADNQSLVRLGLRLILEKEGDIEVVGEADDGRHALSLTDKFNPKVVILDVAMPICNGLTAARQILRNDRPPAVVLMAVAPDAACVQYAVKLGIAAFILKRSRTVDFISAVREASRGKGFICPEVGGILRDMYCSKGLPTQFLNGNSSRLSIREAEVLQLIAEGAGNKQIADELCISQKTVEKHRQQLMEKVRIHHTAGLVWYAIAHGFTVKPENVKAE